MKADCRVCGWRGDARTVTVETVDGDDEIELYRGCPKCGSAKIVLGRPDPDPDAPDTE